MAGAVAAPAGAGGAAPATQFTGWKLLVASFVLAMANFIVVLDLTIANVSIPHIAGGLAVSNSAGTWVITSYAVAEAICVPLTGWLTGRFGAVRTFLFSLAGFGVFSLLCGLSTSLEMLILFRLGQGFCGGPLMPLTQTLMLQIFPKGQANKAMALWAMTVVTAPIIGPIMGGVISDNWSWHWIFIINVPIVMVIFLILMNMLKGLPSPRFKLPIDFVGLILLVIWVGAFQMMVDLGREEDWFSSGTIVALACIAAVFFCIFVIWELTEEHPIVDLKVFRHRGFSASTFSLMLAFGTYFSAVVIIPQWLQTSMSYTATQAGYAMAFAGVLALFVSPFVPKLMDRFDPRLLVFVGLSWLALCTWLRTFWSTDVTFAMVAFPQLIQGLGVALFMVPLTTISLSSVKPEETASAAGIANFGRTLAGAVATAVMTTVWSDYGTADRAELSGSLNGADGVAQSLQNGGFSPEQASGVVEQLVTQQGMAVGTMHIFQISAVALFLAACTIWLGPRPPKGASMGGGH